MEKRLGYPYRALDWQTQNISLFSALQLEKIAMGLIIFFIMVVAAFNIVGTLTMVVADKTREIGILRAMGLTSPSVARIFLIQGAVIGLVGTVLGLIGGLAVAYIVDTSGWIRINPAVYFIDHLPVHVEVLDVASWCWPAWRSPCWRRSIPHDPPRRSRRWKRSATNERRSSRPRACARFTRGATAPRSRSCPGSIWP